MQEIENNEASKYDTGKPPLSLLPTAPLLEVAKVLAFGAEKYARHNWRKGMAYSRLIDAALRHILAFNEGENNDPETGLSHLAHTLCCINFLLEYVLQGTGEDDRHRQSHCDCEEKYNYPIFKGMDLGEEPARATWIGDTKIFNPSDKIINSEELKKFECLEIGKPVVHSTGILGANPSDLVGCFMCAGCSNLPRYFHKTHYDKKLMECMNCHHALPIPDNVK